MQVEKVNEFTWRIPKSGAMKVPAIIYASEKLMAKIRQDKTLGQTANVAKLPGIIKHALTMPDAHQGFWINKLVQPEMGSQLAALQHLIWRKVLSHPVA